MRLSVVIGVIVFFGLSPWTAALALREAKLISQPAISADGATVYFSCWGDLWTAPTDGSQPARRLTDNVAYEGRVTLSPDDQTIAFVSDRFGNYDIFTMPAQGGAATRLTWDDSWDYPYDWKPDGSALLCYLQRQDLWGQCAYELKLDGSEPLRLTGPDHDEHVFTSYLDGTKSIIYARGPSNWAMKRYRGSQNYDLYRVDLATGVHTPLTTWEGKDAWPQPSPDGSRVYFVSDRDGTENIWVLELPSQEQRQLTYFVGDGPRWPRISADGDEIAAEVFGELWIIPTTGDSPWKVPLQFDADPKTEMVVEQTVNGQIGEYALSPNGNYFAVEVYGDIYLLKNPDKYEDDAKPDQDLSQTRPLVLSPGRESQFTWHPDSTKLVYVSDRDGQGDVYLYDLVAEEETQLTDTPEEESYPLFAPQGNRLAYYSGKRKLMLHDLDTGEESVLVDGLLFWGVWPQGFNWAPDGYWLSYQQPGLDYQTEVYLVNTKDRRPVNISLSERYSGDTVWSPDGKYLAYQQTAENGSNIMLVELSPEPETYDLELLFDEDRPAEPVEPAKGGEVSTPDTAPVGTTTDVTGDSPEPSKSKEQPAGKTPAGKADEPKELAPLTIDLTRIHRRAEPLVKFEGYASSPLFDPQSKFLVFATDHAGEPEWWTVSLEDKELNRLGDAKDKVDPQFDPMGKKLYFLEKSRVTYLELDGAKSRGGGSQGITTRLTFNQYVIWEEVLKEGWRILRDSFYDPAMGGADWDGVLERYLPQVRECGTPVDFGALYREMLGEMGRSHLGYSGYGDTREAPPTVTGQLGVVYDEAYAGPGWRVARVIGDSPADQPGCKLAEGDVILAVNGHQITAGDSRERLLANTAGQPVTLTLAGAPAAADQATASETAPNATREVVIKPITRSPLWDLSYEQWVRDNREMIDRLSGERVGYLHIERMNGGSLARFRRELFAENADKAALIIDVRFNGGGSTAVEIMDILDERPAYYRQPRDAEVMNYGRQLVWQGPIVVLINPHSFSNAEILAHILRDAGLATLIGEATPGGVISTGTVTLMDGSRLGVPSGGNYRLNGDDMETHGAQPDVLVVIDPQAVAAGRDNQIEVAVDYLLSQLESGPAD